MSVANSTIPSGFCQIPDFARYAISKDGIVLSICRRARGANRPWSEARRISTSSLKQGYPFVQLQGEDGPRDIKVHTLMLETFVGPRPDGMQCRHLDGDKTNNRITNLTWGTGVENQHDRILHGTSSQGEKHHYAKLTNDDVLEIRRRAANGELHRVIAADFPVTSSSVQYIVNRRTWRHI